MQMISRYKDPPMMLGLSSRGQDTQCQTCKFYVSGAIQVPVQSPDLLTSILLSSTVLFLIMKGLRATESQGSHWYFTSAFITLFNCSFPLSNFIIEKKPGNELKGSQSFFISSASEGHQTHGFVHGKNNSHHRTTIPGPMRKYLSSDTH